MSDDIQAVDDEGYGRLSNGAKYYVGRDGGDSLTEASRQFLERMIAAGHTPATDEDGAVDMFYTSGGYCNGPGCADCHETTCMHCQPDWHPEPCIGADGYQQVQRAKRYAEFLELKAEFEPNGGQHD